MQPANFSKARVATEIHTMNAAGASTCRGQLSGSVCLGRAAPYISNGRLPGLEAPAATGSEPVHSNDARALAAAGAAAF